MSIDFILKLGFPLTALSNQKFKEKMVKMVWMDNGHVENMVHTQQASLKHTSFAKKYHVYD